MLITEQVQDAAQPPSDVISAPVVVEVVEGTSTEASNANSADATVEVTRERKFPRPGGKTERVLQAGGKLGAAASRRVARAAKHATVMFSAGANAITGLVKKGSSTSYLGAEDTEDPQVFAAEFLHKLDEALGGAAFKYVLDPNVDNFNRLQALKSLANGNALIKKAVGSVVHSLSKTDKARWGNVAPISAPAPEDPVVSESVLGATPAPAGAEATDASTSAAIATNDPVLVPVAN